ncbi:hypothetical protein D3C76_1440780 [compost metagenome]
MGHAVITERLFAMQDARSDDAQFVTPGVRRDLELQREQKGRRQRQVGVTGIAGGLLVEVDRIGFPGGLGEEAQLPGFGGDEEGGQLLADVFLVDHLNDSRVCWPLQFFWYTVTTQAPPRPRLCCTAMRAFCTWRCSAVPRS